MSRSTVKSRFYSLSCETYSGTAVAFTILGYVVFLFAVVRDVQRNLWPSASPS